MESGRSFPALKTVRGAALTNIFGRVHLPQLRLHYPTDEYQLVMRQSSLKGNLLADRQPLLLNLRYTIWLWEPATREVSRF